MAHWAKSVLRVDDEAEMLEPPRIFLRDKKFQRTIESPTAPRCRGRLRTGAR